MLDIRAQSGTPGAVATLANINTLIPTDGSVVPGVPLRSDARLIMWGSASLIANTIAASKLAAQDCIDPINGEQINPSTASLKNLAYKYTNIPYKTGSRVISQGTNTAQTATSLGFCVDYYDHENHMGGTGLRFLPKQISIPQVAGQADVAISWSNTPYAPATQIPNGKYALLGFYLALSTGAHCIKFIHADFGFCQPGLPTVDHMASAILGAQEVLLDPLYLNPGYQFAQLSELTGKPCVPVFRVSPAGTGLTISSLATATTNTPQITPVLAKLDD